MSSQTKHADTNIDLLMYADDVVVIGETENDLQVMLNNIDNWCKMWGICINVRKPRCFTFVLKEHLYPALNLILEFSLYP